MLSVAKMDVLPKFACVKWLSPYARHTLLQLICIVDAKNENANNNTFLLFTNALLHQPSFLVAHKHQTLLLRAIHDSKCNFYELFAQIHSIGWGLNLSSQNMICTLSFCKLVLITLVVISLCFELCALCKKGPKA